MQDRPDPDALLQRMQQERRAQARAAQDLLWRLGRRGQDLRHAVRRPGRAGAGRGRGDRRGRDPWPRRHRALARATCRAAAAAVPYRDRTSCPSSTWTRRWPGRAAADPWCCWTSWPTATWPVAPPQALAGRRGTAGRRHRRVVDDERAAPGEPERHRQRHHRHPRLGDRARPVLRRSRRGGGGRPAARRTAGAPEGRQGLPAAAGRARRRQLLPQGQPAGPARAGAAPHRRPGGRRDARLPARRSPVQPVWPNREALLACVGRARTPRRWCAAAPAWPPSSTCPGTRCMWRHPAPSGRPTRRAGAARAEARQELGATTATLPAPPACAGPGALCARAQPVRAGAGAQRAGAGRGRPRWPTRSVRWPTTWT
jgi:hypothetical protein